MGHPLLGEHARGRPAPPGPALREVPGVRSRPPGGSRPGSESEHRDTGGPGGDARAGPRRPAGYGGDRAVPPAQRGDRLFPDRGNGAVGPQGRPGRIGAAGGGQGAERAGPRRRPQCDARARGGGGALRRAAGDRRPSAGPSSQSAARLPRAPWHPLHPELGGGLLLPPAGCRLRAAAARPGGGSRRGSADVPQRRHPRPAHSGGARARPVRDDPPLRRRQRSSGTGAHPHGADAPGAPRRHDSADEPGPVDAEQRVRRGAVPLPRGGGPRRAGHRVAPTGRRRPRQAGRAERSGRARKVGQSGWARQPRRVDLILPRGRRTGLRPGGEDLHRAGGRTGGME